MDSYQTRIQKAKKAIAEAEYILLGGGAGISAAASILYSGKRFTENFAPSIRNFELHDMYMTGLSTFPAQEDKWGFWAKLIRHTRYEAGPARVYKDLYSLISEKHYFVLTTTVDSQFEMAGFSSDKVFEVQGNYGKLQCAIGCHDRIYSSEIPVMEMAESIVDYKIPLELVPKCPVCGGKMIPNIRNNKNFFQDEKFFELEALYKGFVLESMTKKRLYIGLGVDSEPLVILKQDDPIGFEQNNRNIISFHEGIHETVSALSK
ncbi:hypothetical protein SAMN04487969_101805 [Paenibacillus algorifonticola]|uniref:Deacetylase sirtuin-type domain-containing protein n=1 Tax=Paenibacillus algorifonticola TaxID=684063 RepID=A0A1I1YUR7_9BACL|nr:hypothetical protein [Paenibacillus algorifonticola]SFE23354.1 hypothetical protein SAMN04487969_101805 [Paenibacillus algorifonticola]